MSNKITIVTGLWNIGRDTLQEGWSRSYQHYLNKFEELLKIDVNLIIFGDAELEKFVFERRQLHNTQFINRNLEWFKNNDYYLKIQDIRNTSSWVEQAEWLVDSTQARLEMYNPLVMSKMFLLNDARLMDAFNSEYMFWLDAGITNTVHPGYFTHDNVLEKIEKYIKKFSFICFPYEANNEIHGFNYEKINEIAGAKIERVARGGFFGGPKNTIQYINSIYYDLLITTLSNSLMGTEESLFSIMCYKFSNIINYFEIESNGLIGTFFENLKNDNLKIEFVQDTIIESFDINKVGLYVITYNSPKQFETLIESMLAYDTNYINKTQKFLLDNSSDETTFEKYSSLCKQYNFEHIKKDNLGICGGRQFIAEHFDKTGLDFMLFFEDDMFFYTGQDKTCSNGFIRKIADLYTNTLKIVKQEKLDFIKLNFTEFYGDNSTQWAWYNVPQVIREAQWPNNKRLPELGLDPNAPKTLFKEIKSYERIPYALGEVYYCNWPQVVTKIGNKKMFLETTWAHPFEQTWMSYIYQKTISKEITSGILLATPTSHNRFEHYKSEERKES